MDHFWILLINNKIEIFDNCTNVIVRYDSMKFGPFPRAWQLVVVTYQYLIRTPPVRIFTLPLVRCRLPPHMLGNWAVVFHPICRYHLRPSCPSPC